MIIVLLYIDETQIKIINLN